MNLIESMSAWLAYKRYVAQHATTAEGQTPGATVEGQFGPADLGPATVYLPGDGFAAPPLYRPSGRWSTGLDGTVSEHLAGGRVLAFRRNADGTLTLSEQGSGQETLIQEEAGTITVTPEGAAAVQFTDPEGDTVLMGAVTLRENADGSLTELHADGASTTWHTDGSRVWQGADGSLQVRDENGVLTATKGAGGDWTWYEADGTVARTATGDVTELRMADGSRTVVTGGTVTSVTLQDGSAAVKQADGTWRGTEVTGAVHLFDGEGWLLKVTYSSGRFVEHTRDEATRETQTNGVVTWRLPDGVTVSKEPGGLVRATDGAGNALAASAGPNGELAVVEADGGRIYLQQDLGRRLESGGQSLTVGRDGSREWRLLGDVVVRMDRAGAFTGEHLASAILEHDGELVAHATSGLVARVAADLSGLYSATNGAALRVSASGTQEALLPDGTRIVLGAQPQVHEPGQVPVAGAYDAGRAVGRGRWSTL